MITNTVFECAASYLYAPVRPAPLSMPAKNDTRKLEAVSATGNKKRFNANAEKKANFSQHIDICI